MIVKIDKRVEKADSKVTEKQPRASFQGPQLDEHKQIDAVQTTIKEGSTVPSQDETVSTRPDDVARFIIKNGKPEFKFGRYDRDILIESARDALASIKKNATPETAHNFLMDVCSVFKFPTELINDRGSIDTQGLEIALDSVESGNESTLLEARYETYEDGSINDFGQVNL